MTKRRKPRKTLPGLAQEIVARSARAGYLDRLYRVRSRKGCPESVADVALSALRPHVPRPAFEYKWVARPRYRESIRQYACRAVERAAVASNRYGGLVGVNTTL